MTATVSLAWVICVIMWDHVTSCGIMWLNMWWCYPHAVHDPRSTISENMQRTVVNHPMRFTTLRYVYLLLLVPCRPSHLLLLKRNFEKRGTRRAWWRMQPWDVACSSLTLNANWLTPAELQLKWVQKYIVDLKITTSSNRGLFNLCRLCCTRILSMLMSQMKAGS